MNRAERATINFYTYDLKLRGYYLFDMAVDIEVPFVPFEHITDDYEEIVDDSKVPSLFSKARSLLSPKKELPQETTEEVVLMPVLQHDETKLTGFTISFPYNDDVPLSLNEAFLNTLSPQHPLSFEIYATHDTIQIQMIMREDDVFHVKTQTKAFFPNATLTDIAYHDLDFDFKKDVAIADFGIKNEVGLPITNENQTIDPFTSLFAVLNNLGHGEVALLQIIFKPSSNPWAKNILYAVSDGYGGSFFDDASIQNEAKNKVSSPLFSVIVRIATQGNNDRGTERIGKYLAERIAKISSSQTNSLIPLSNKHYEYQHHLKNVYFRSSNRWGMLLNTQELSTLVHYPSSSVVSQKLRPQRGKTKLLPALCVGQKYILGINQHENEQHEVSISDETYSKHILITGSTGTGKSHLLRQLIAQDIEKNNACFVIDPHGDLIDDVVSNVTDEHKDNIVFINLEDQEYAFGLNIFQANTEAEKNVLASDLASAFYDTFISSGDRIQSVLQKTISTFVYADTECSLLDMKRFLLESSYRSEFLTSIDDPLLLYYWENEFPLYKKHELSPLLLRIDNFIQTRLLRNVFAQKRGINFTELVNQKKTVLIKLSVGLIGLQNAKFLAHLLITKINQLAFARQSLPHSKRHPIHLFIDEAHNFAQSDVIEQILSGARKFGLSLVFSIQHLDLVNTILLNSILTNANTQVFFRLSDKDARRIAPTYSYFDAEDFMELERGQALIKINKRSNDFNLVTLPIERKVSKEKTEQIRNYIAEKSQRKYATPVSEIDDTLIDFIPKKKTVAPKEEAPTQEIKPHDEEKQEDVIESVQVEEVSKTKSEPLSNLEEQKQQYIKAREERDTIREHVYLQNLIKRLAEQRGFKAVLEAPTETGGKVDVGLIKDDKRIAVEISVTNTVQYEVQNILKCIMAGYDLIFMVSKNSEHLATIQEKALKEIDKSHHSKIHFYSVEQFTSFLNSIDAPKPAENVVKGFRVKVAYDSDGLGDDKNYINKIVADKYKKK